MTFLAKKPKILVNSIQKAGTHVLTNALHMALPQRYIGRGAYNHCLTQLWESRYSNLITSDDSVVNLVKNKYYPGEIIQGHIEFSDELIRKLPNEVIRFLIIRNPYDVVLSLANWWERHNEIQVKPYIAYKQIRSKEDKLEFLITGFYNGVKIWPSLAERYEAYEGWLFDKNTHIIKFESLVNSPDKEINRIELFLDLKISKNKFMEGMNPNASKTFTIKDEKVFNKIPMHLKDIFLDQGGENVLNIFGY